MPNTRKIKPLTVTLVMQTESLKQLLPWEGLGLGGVEGELVVGAGVVVVLSKQSQVGQSVL